MLEPLDSILTLWVSYIKMWVIKPSHLHLIPFHFYNFLPGFWLPSWQGRRRLRAGQDHIRLLGSRDGLKLPGCCGLCPAGGWEAGTRLLAAGAFRAFRAFVANADVAIAMAAAAMAMVAWVAGARIHNKLKQDHKWVNYPPIRKAMPSLANEPQVSELLL